MGYQQFEFGDRVRHLKRPEWGVGSVVKVESTTIDGQAAQRLSIRFPTAGMKTLSTLHAELEHAPAEVVSTNGHAESGTLAEWGDVGDENWLASVAKKKIEEAMLGVPEQARDPFRGLRARLEYTLDLYRFDRTGGKLVDWARAQSGLEDPLTRFTRHDLEQFFDRWAMERDNHLAKLLGEARVEQAMVRELLVKAPASGRDAVRRINARMLT